MNHIDKYMMGAFSLTFPGNPAIFDALLPHLATAITHPNGRTELLNLLNKYLSCYTGDANILTGPLLDALQDKVSF